MRLELTRQFLALAVLVAALRTSDASQNLERLLRRQAGEGEQESTTPKAQENTQQAPPNGSQQPRLYPDLPRQPNFLPPFNAPPGNGFQPPSLVPFGMQMPPTNRLNIDQQPSPFGRIPAQQPRPMTAAERLQSQSFANGLGRRLLAMVGVDTDNSGAQANAASAGQPQNIGGSNEEALKALQNSTVLQQLNQGVHSIYGGLSKMYNSTIQEQLNLLQDRFRSETANSTNPWHQRMAQQVPAFFKQVAGKVGEAQEQLNRVWRDLSQTNSSILNRQHSDQPPSFFGSFDQFFNDQGNGDFLNRAFGGNGANGDGGSAMKPNQTIQTQDIATKLRNMWQTQVEPELMMVRNRVSRVWRDLIASGAAIQDPILRSRHNNVVSSSNGSSADLVDSILKEVDINSPEYVLDDPKNVVLANTGESSAQVDGSKPSQQDGPGLKLSPQMQNRIVQMQSDLNRLWMGVTNSLQAALANVKRSVNPQPHFEMLNPTDLSNKQADPQQNEISDRIKDLAKVQRDADMVRAEIEQQQREMQQRQSFGDRFRGLLNNVDMRGINQLPDRIGEQFNRFGTAVGNFWNRLPERWDNFMTNVRQPQASQMNSRLQTSASTASTTNSPSEK